MRPSVGLKVCGRGRGLGGCGVLGVAVIVLKLVQLNVFRWSWLGVLQNSWGVVSLAAGGVGCVSENAAASSACRGSRGLSPSAVAFKALAWAKSLGFLLPSSSYRAK